MNGRELLLKALKNEETPRPAWVPFVGVHGGQLLGLTAPEYLRSADHIVEGQTLAASEYQADGVPVVFDLQIEAEVLGCDLDWPDDGPPSVTTHPLELDPDLSALPDFDTSAGRMPVVAEAARRLHETIGESVAIYGLITGPFTLALHLRGNMIFLDMYDDPDRVSALLDYCADIATRMAKLYTDNGADIIAVVDPMTSQVSAEHFTAFVTPAANKLFDAVHEQSALGSFFVCGDATRNLEAMAETHCDNMSVDENISLELLRELGEKHGKSVGGNLKLTLALLLGTPDTCRRDAIRCIDACGTRGFVLAPGCDLPWGVPPENLKAVAEMVHDEYRRDVARTALEADEEDSFDDIFLPNYVDLDEVVVDVVTLDSSSCAPCQYMLVAAQKAAEMFDDTVVVREHRIKNREGLGYMCKLNVAHIPSICIDGNPVFESIIPDKHVIEEAIRKARAEKTQ